MAEVTVQLSLAKMGELAKSASQVEQGFAGLARQLVRNDGRDQNEAYTAVCEMRQAFETLIIRMNPSLLLQY